MDVILVDIYALIDPITKSIKYIGKANNYKRRYKTHISASKTKNTPVYNWINDLRLLGLMPEIQLIKMVIKQNRKILIWKL